MKLEAQGNPPEVEAALLDDYAREHIREKDIWSLP